MQLPSQHLVQSLGNHSKDDQACSTCEVQRFEYAQLNLNNPAKSIQHLFHGVLVFLQLLGACVKLHRQLNQLVQSFVH
jgi:hypothetical protein